MAICGALASASSSFLTASRVSETALSGSNQRSTATRAPSTSQQTLVVKCGRQDDIDREGVNFTRRKVFSLGTLSLFMAASNAQAKDVPLFGFKKQLESAKKAVDTGLEDVTSSVQDTLGGIEAPSVSGFSPILQAGSILGAELVAVVIASSVVSSGVPSK